MALVIFFSQVNNMARLVSPPRGQNGQPNPHLNPEQFAKEVQQQLRLNKSVNIPIYRKPHLERVDADYFDVVFGCEGTDLFAAFDWGDVVLFGVQDDVLVDDFDSLEAVGGCGGEFAVDGVGGVLAEGDGGYGQLDVWGDGHFG